MNTEIEVKFLGVDMDDMRNKLAGMGGICEKPMRTMRRVTIDNPIMKSKEAFLRVRDEGDKVTLTYKQFDSPSLHGAKEIEVTVSDFDATISLLEHAGLPYGSFQESRRETWRVGACEVMVDEWPWLRPYVEIEGSNEASIREVADRLGLDWKDGAYGDVMAAYRAEYPHLGTKDTIGDLPQVRFGDPLPDMLKAARA